MTRAASTPRLVRLIGAVGRVIGRVVGSLLHGVVFCDRQRVKTERMIGRVRSFVNGAEWPSVRRLSAVQIMDAQLLFGSELHKGHKDKEDLFREQVEAKAGAESKVTPGETGGGADATRPAAATES